MNDIELIKQAYLLLLQLNGEPRFRMSGQHVLCGLRDRLAEVTGQTPQAIQEAFEEDALLRRIGQRREDAPIILLSQ